MFKSFQTLFLLSFAFWLSYSQLCPLDYFFDTQHCQKCLPNCKCISQNGCDSCIEGYTMFKNQCVQCPTANGIYGACTGCCSRTQGTILACTDCAKVNNYYSFLFSGRCILSEGCFEVDSNGYCQLCRTSFYPHNNLCSPCDPSCATCVGPSNCLTCAPGYNWKVADYGLCTACPAGCAQCSQTTCSSCLQGFYFFRDHCLQCPSNCLTCVDGSTCTKCSAGILVSNLCVICNDATYGGSAGCSTCYADNNFIKCSSCFDEYFLDSVNGACRSCEVYIGGASMCNDENTPIQCLNDHDPILTNRYYLVGIVCIKNSKSCKKILDINGSCSSCYDSYRIQHGACIPCDFTNCADGSVINNVCTCAVCSTGFYLNVGVCTACSTSNCADCASNTCTACISGFYLNSGSCTSSTAANCLVSSSGSSTLCDTCNDGFFLGSDDICYNCQTGCLKCSNKYTCSECSAGRLLVNAFCMPFPSNCVMAQLKGAIPTCTLCNHGYFLNSGNCIECSVELGTLSKCDGLCPIDYYIQSLMVQVFLSQGSYIQYSIMVIMGLIFYF